jgi:hypothetical protein
MLWASVARRINVDVFTNPSEPMVEAIHQENAFV